MVLPVWVMCAGRREAQVGPAVGLLARMMRVGGCRGGCCWAMEEEKPRGRPRGAPQGKPGTFRRFVEIGRLELHRPAAAGAAAMGPAVVLLAWVMRGGRREAQGGPAVGLRARMMCGGRRGAQVGPAVGLPVRMMCGGRREAQVGPAVGLLARMSMKI